MFDRCLLFIAEKYCAPGSFFKLDCNTCTCSEDGTFAACTDMICPPEITNYDMAPSKFLKNDD